MPFNINEFLSNINRGGVAKTANFQVMVQRPFSGSSGIERDMMFRCSAITNPSRRVDTTESLDYSLLRPIAYGSTMGDLNMRIILSEDLREKEYFEEWIDKIVGPYRNGSLADNMFNVGFYDDYAMSTIIEISQYGASGEKTYQHSVKEAFPIQLSPIENDWAVDQIMYIDVSWKYRYYTSRKINTQTA